MNIAHDRVPPSPEVLARQYGERVSFCDLRCGGNTGELEQSVTALEIEYGTRSNPEQLERTLFYFRAFEGEVPASYGPEDPQHVAKLEDLKGRIRKLAGGTWSCHNSSSSRPAASGLRPWCPWRGGCWKKRKQSKRVHSAVLLMERECRLVLVSPSPSSGHGLHSTLDENSFAKVTKYY